VYKDLEPSKVYEFGTVREIYSSILDTINDLYEYLNLKNTKLVNDKEQITMGINIDNIINNEQFTNTLLNERITMYIKYLEVINKHHSKYMNRLIRKCKLAIEIFNEDIQIKQMNNDVEEDKHVVTEPVEHI
jgi:hypothetical protein